ncbi:hypothetical protein CW707_01970 [Candidatus Bathyarchaeota archaeon]|nr:MAG: hypothetical protein CW667_03910 [Candidatus Bathyarchaeota archaeon]RJS82048.1 MAG: hypothetical protein CW707_01970 [Candidatus Bathyarchaeota archaeon]
MKNLLQNDWFEKIILILWLASSVFIVFLIRMMDNIVHSDLYNYGLQFSSEWAVPYWSMLRLIYICLALPAALSIVTLGISLWRYKFKQPSVSRKVKSKLIESKIAQPKENHMLISCPKCKRVFSKPMVMLDFSSGRSRLVNVCPYCNYVLSREGEETEKEDVRVADLNEKRVEY